MKTPCDLLSKALLDSRRWQRCFAGAAVAGVMLLSGGSLRAQSDDFDDGDDAGWVRINPVAAFGGTTSYSYPEGPTGKGYRIQCQTAEAIPGAAGTGRSFNFRTNEYTDFFVAVDVVNWDDSLNQAVVLAARFRGEDTVLEPCPLGPGACTPGFGVMDGYVANYDPKQFGSTAGSRLGGQFQINRILHENPAPTYAVANVVLTPGKSYRFTFKGVGPRLTAEIFDFEDLTAPLVSIETDKGTEFPSGKCGLIAFSRDRTTADMTYDNYFASAYDPANPPAVPAPAAAASLAGTPQVVSRVPASRFATFHPPASGVSFTTTNIGGTIDPASIRLYLNGESANPLAVSGPADGPTLTYGGTLAANTVYEGRLELANGDGSRKSTNVFWFDTVSDAFLDAGPAKVIEAEDFNSSADFITGGQYIDDPLVTGLDVNGQAVNPGLGYFGLLAAPGIDFVDNRSAPETDAGGRLSAYRGVAPGTQQGDPDDIQDLNHPALTAPFPNDYQRAKYAAASLPEYQLTRTEAGEWVNYTRTFVSQNYHVYLRVGSLGENTNSLSTVGGSPTTADQIPLAAGTFLIPNTFRRSNYRFVPLTAAGSRAVLRLSEVQTLRLTQGGVPSKHNRLLALNYLLFVPTADPVSSVVVLESAPTVNGPYTNTGVVVDQEFRTITLPQSDSARFFRLRSEKPYRIEISRQGGDVVITYND